jgi:hypothetical protein
MSLGRRSFLARSAALGGLALPFWALFERTAKADDGFGPLVPDTFRSERFPNGIMDLPEGFRYTIVQQGSFLVGGDPTKPQAGDAMDDGFVMPGFPDGMAAFAGPDGGIVLLRNHELDVGDPKLAPLGAAPAGSDMTDAHAAAGHEAGQIGGVSRVQLDASGRLVASHLVLTGTIRNCCGGLTPWGWISCEEASFNDKTPPNHGYAFLVPLAASAVHKPIEQADISVDELATLDRPLVIRSYGRFNHEAATIDPDTMIAYLTEDVRPSTAMDGTRIPGAAFYRFVPDDPRYPFVGKLQALRVKGQDAARTVEFETGTIVDVEWIDVDDPDPVADDAPIRFGAFERGAAEFYRAEGLWIARDEGAIYFSCTGDDNPMKVVPGQIFRLVDGDAPTLEVVARGTTDLSTTSMRMPDNITVAPWGDIYIAEDNKGDCFLRVLDRRGNVTPLARNATAVGSEFAGVCFSPDGTKLFVNMQGEGLTLMIEGPFQGVDGEGDGKYDDIDGEVDDDGAAGCNVAAGGADAGVLALAGVALAAGLRAR